MRRRSETLNPGTLRPNKQVLPPKHRPSRHLAVTETARGGVASRTSRAQQARGSTENQTAEHTAARAERKDTRSAPRPGTAAQNPAGNKGTTLNKTSHAARPDKRPDIQQLKFQSH